MREFTMNFLHQATAVATNKTSLKELIYLNMIKNTSVLIYRRFSNASVKNKLRKENLMKTLTSFQLC